ncbi:hypothetical protein [Streptomyces sp. NPDC020917]|uniref:hypothetical protein n=1 Tax=Streptomyces sp. NPDC020917 TaxID=3365102 RepID=UPI0037AE7038
MPAPAPPAVPDHRLRTAVARLAVVDWPVPDPSGAGRREVYEVRDDLDIRTSALLAELLPDH